MISCTAEFINQNGVIHEIYFRNKTFNVSNMKVLSLSNKFDYMMDQLLEKEYAESGLKFQNTQYIILEKQELK